MMQDFDYTELEFVENYICVLDWFQTLSNTQQECMRYMINHTTSVSKVELTNNMLLINNFKTLTEISGITWLDERSLTVLYPFEILSLDLDTMELQYSLNDTLLYFILNYKTLIDELMVLV